MPALRRTATTLGATFAATVLVAGMTTVPAAAADRELRYAGADVEFEVEKDDGRFDIEVDVDVDDARPGSRWRVVLRHEDKRFHNKVHRADDDGELDIEKTRGNTRGRDVFKLRIKKVGADRAAVRTIRTR